MTSALPVSTHFESPVTTRRYIAVAIVAALAGAVAFTIWRPSQEHEREPSEGPPSGPVWFEDVTDAVGLNFVHDAGPTGSYFLPQIQGSGGAFLDFDGDGRLDIFLIQQGGPKSGSVNRLFHQKPDGTYEDVTAGSGLDVAGYGMGVAVGDVNGDGKPDILLTEYAGVKLFLNLGNGKFADITESSGLVNPLWATSAAFLDYDRDGRLDLFVVNYIDYDQGTDCAPPNGVKDYCTPFGFRHTSSKLFRNLGPQPARGDRPAVAVRFEDVSVATGIGTIPGPGLGIAVADFDGDGWPDIFVANDGAPNHLWMNHPGQPFTEEAVVRGVAYNCNGKAFAGMGVGIGDVDNDGLLDLYVTHLTSETNTLWKQGPRGLFTDGTAGAGLAATNWRGTGFGTVMADFDQDGFLDIAVVNGRVSRADPPGGPGLTGFWAHYGQRNQIFSNAGGGRFTDISPHNAPFCGHQNVGRGLICGDFNNDGAPDLLVTAIGGRARLFKNVVPNRGHWLGIRALDPQRNRDAYGAEVVVRAGSRHWVRALNPAQSYLCSSSPVAHIGLGTANAITAIEVAWPDGKKEVFPGGGVDRVVELRQGTGRTP